MLQVSPTEAPTPNPTKSPTSQQPEENLRAIVCGRGYDCAEGVDDVVNMNESHEVRCCRNCVKDGPCNNGWKQKCSEFDPEVYGRSKFAGKCYEEDFCSAVNVCEEKFGGRLCTPEEVIGSCTKGTGCNYDREMIWACMYEAGRCERNEECCSGRCSQDGLCLAAEPGMCN
mmetsp:Transcript_30937/g.57280  ORF Transcript_30937/g.57280 Transcript_30937/m.57280 type:complete len:171 (+) Transcript_30937:34-546(+)